VRYGEGEGAEAAPIKPKNKLKINQKTADETFPTQYNKRNFSSPEQYDDNNTLYPTHLLPKFSTSK
jgi:hypothetical protein